MHEERAAPRRPAKPRVRARRGELQRHLPVERRALREAAALDQKDPRVGVRRHKGSRPDAERADPPLPDRTAERIAYTRLPVARRREETVPFAAERQEQALRPFRGIRLT